MRKLHNKIISNTTSITSIFLLSFNRIANAETTATQLLSTTSNTDNNLSHLITNYGSIILAILAAGIILLLAKRKTPRGFSFKVRTSLNSIVGYAKLFYNGNLGPVSIEQKEMIDHILSATLTIASEIDKIETMHVTKPDRRMSFVLRTSLMDISGYCDLLYRTEPKITAEQRECLDEIHQGSKLILHLLSENN